VNPEKMRQTLMLQLHTIYSKVRSLQDLMLGYWLEELAEEKPDSAKLFTLEDSIFETFYKLRAIKEKLKELDSECL